MDQVDAWLQVIGAWGYALLGLAALVEYLLPIFPGDVVVVSGGAWLAREHRSVALLMTALTLGSALGLTVTWFIGRRLAGRLHRLPPEGRVLGVKVAQLQRAEAAINRRAAWWLLGNRFMPGLRTVVLISSGVAGVPLWRVLVFGSLSGLVFNGLLVFAGVTIGDNAEALATFFLHFRRTTAGVAALVVVVLVARWWWRRRKRASAPHDVAS